MAKKIKATGRPPKFDLANMKVGDEIIFTAHFKKYSQQNANGIAYSFVKYRELKWVFKTKRYKYLNEQDKECIGVKIIRVK